MTSQLKIAGLCKSFGTQPVIKGVDLEVKEGEFVALLGPSGCGKTTTLRIVAGLEPADSGTIGIAGREVMNDSKSVPAERRKVGLVFQEYALFPHLTVGRNVAFGLSRGSPRKTVVADFLALVGLAGLQDRYPRELSGGQQQRVALARALAPRPDILLLDEPFSNLDPALRSQVRAEVRDILKASGCTSVLVTHDQEEALSMADRIAIMFDGRITQFESARELYDRPTSIAVASFVGDACFLPGIANGRTIHCALGQLRITESASGPRKALVRPEMIVLLTADSPFGVEARITSSRFFGHDQLFACQLVDGTMVEARVIGMSDHAVGNAVRLAVRGAVLTFSG